MIGSTRGSEIGKNLTVDASTSKELGKVQGGGCGPEELGKDKWSESDPEFPPPF
jgi:hypothetical protein